MLQLRPAGHVGFIPHSQRGGVSVGSHTSLAGHMSRTESQRQVPDVQVKPVAQTFPQLLQLFSSVRRFTHPTPGQQISKAPVHSAPPGAEGHEQAPPEQTSPEPHLSQVGPQFRASVSVSVQVDSPQQVSVGAPEHVVIADGQ